MDIWQTVVYNISVPAAMLVASAGTDHHHEKGMTMADPIMRPVLIEARVAQYIVKPRTYIHRYACTVCGGPFDATQGTVNGGRYSCNPCSLKRVTAGKVTHGHNPYRKASVQLNRWWGMKKRCEQPTWEHYDQYGGRGIKICDEWQTFEGFMQWEHFEDIKAGLEIDRIDTDGDYSPSNCRLVTHVENSRNKRNAKLNMEAARLIRSYYYSGVPQYVLADMFGTNGGTIHHVVNFKQWNEVYPPRPI